MLFMTSVRYPFEMKSDVQGYNQCNQMMENVIPCARIVAKLL